MGIVVTLEGVLAARGMTVAQLADATGITAANLFVLKGDRAKAVRFSTLAALCAVLDCQPGDLLRYQADPDAR